MRFFLSVFGFVILLRPITAIARFHPNKIENLALEEKLGTEYYNDVFSYEFPNSWQKKWWEYTTMNYRALSEESTAKLRAAYLSSVGSLNANIFLHQERLMLQSAPRSAFSLMLSRQRWSDLLIDEVEHELHLVFRPNIVGTYYKIMFEPMGAKKWIDIGFALGFVTEGRGFFELFYYSVDHYYNTKEESGQGRYIKKPWHAGAKTAWRLTPFVEFDFSYAYSSEVSWSQPQFARKTDYDDRDLKAQIEYHDESIGRFSLFHQSQNSQHAIENQLTTTDNVTELLLSEQGASFHSSGVAWSYELSSRTELDVNFRHLERHVQRTLIVSEDFTQDSAYFNFPQPLTVSRQEQLLAATATQKNFGLNNNLIYGFLVSNVALKKTIQSDGEDGKRRQEYKFRFNIDHVVSDNGSIIFGSNWDLDKLVGHFPYNKKRFEAWDGGSIAVSLWL